MSGSLGNNLRLLRMKRKLSQAALAARLGVSQKIISAYERDYRSPPSTMIPRVAEELDASLEELFGAPSSGPTDDRPRLRREALWRIVEKLESLPYEKLPDFERSLDRLIASDTPKPRRKRS